MMSGQPPAECCVSGALGCALRMSRVAGVAPLRLRRLRTGWRARLSPAATVYGNILVVALCGLAAAAFAMDYNIGSKTPVELGIQKKRAIHVTELAFLTAVLVTTAFTGTTRMKNMIVYLNQIHKANLELSCYGCTPSNDKKFWLLLILTMIVGSSTIAMTVVEFIHFSISHGSRVYFWVLYLFYFILYLMLPIIQIQFALLIIAALLPLKQLNGCLNNLLEQINSQANSRHISLKKLKINNFILPDVAQPSPTLQRDIPKAVHQLTRVHSSMCDVVRLVGDSHGPILLGLVLLYLLHLLLSMYFVFDLILNDAGPTVSIGYFNSIINLSWCIFHIGGLIILVEPCHQTQEEMANTREIVSQMIQQVISPDDPLSIELDQFYRYLILNQVTYSPLKMLTLNRGLIVTILSTITTYLVVVIEF